MLTNAFHPIRLSLSEEEWTNKKNAKLQLKTIASHTFQIFICENVGNNTSQLFVKKKYSHSYQQPAGEIIPANRSQ